MVPITTRTRNVAIFGSTGSIGRSTLEVIRASGGRIEVGAISAHTSLELLLRQAQETQPRWIIASDDEAASKFNWRDLPKQTELLMGPEGLEKVATDSEIDIVVAAIVGSAGLKSTWAALEAGKTVALANKETLVMAGPLVTQLAKERNATILPVDSEHSAVFQALRAGNREEVKRIILTASGGPFWRHTLEQLSQVTVSEALSHPTWEMGRKITVDSATMMNKALEIVEARWLFDLEVDQIDVVIHPQSIVHSLVEYKDGSVIAQLSPPDMKLPIQFALSYPQRWEGPAEKLDLSKPLHFEFEPPDEERFPALALGREVARSGGTSGAVLNAANEAAVTLFLDERLSFNEIVPACRAVLENHHYDPSPTLAELFRHDAWAREEILRWICI